MFLGLVMTAPVKKGQLLIVKVPPYYEKEYFYEVTSAGDKLIRANLYRSPKVKRSWNIEEFGLLIEMGMLRIASENEAPPAVSKSSIDDE
jgi:hypothetical protein